MRHDYNAIGVSATALGTTHIGFVAAHKFGGSVFVEEVIVEEDGGNSGLWNVQLGGRELFSQTQSVATGTTPETFVPDQNRYATGDNLELIFDRANQESGSQTYNVAVSLSTGEDVE